MLLDIDFVRVDLLIISWHFATHLSHMKLPEMPAISRPTDIPLS